jgi:glycosyltransferase involved in cell wall biosynthesis
VADIYLSVVIPSYNELANLRKGVLDKIDHFLSQQKYSYEVLVVDDGSDDGSKELVEAFVRENSKFRLIKNIHSGKAGAVTSGMLEAKGEIRLFTDMDQATPIEEINKFIPFFASYDIVIGSRKNERKNSPWSRKIMSRGFMFLREAIVGLNGISDTQCGFKALKGEVAEKVFERVNKVHNGFKIVSGSSVTAGFDVELLFIAGKMGYKIKEVPVEWLYVETRRVGIVKDSFEGLVDLFRIRADSFAGKYKA